MPPTPTSGPTTAESTSAWSPDADVDPAPPPQASTAANIPDPMRIPSASRMRAAYRSRATASKASPALAHAQSRPLAVTGAHRTFFQAPCR